MGETFQHLLSIKDLDHHIVHSLFCRALELKRCHGSIPEKKRVLKEQMVATLFWEPSTRTRVSFELAALRLGAHVLHMNPAWCSAMKGETLEDTYANLVALGCRYFVVRHSQEGKAKVLAQGSSSLGHVINAGDGTNEHPSQALLDAFTLWEQQGSLKGLKIAILGDVLRSRVARSDIDLFSRLGARCFLSGPLELMPEKVDVQNAEIVMTADDAVRDADVILVLRQQKERTGVALRISDETYLREYGLTRSRMRLAKPKAIVMHPGPINRGVEIESEVADGDQSMILEQVKNGLFMRMAIFESLAGSPG